MATLKAGPLRPGVTALMLSALFGISTVIAQPAEAAGTAKSTKTQSSKTSSKHHSKKKRTRKTASKTTGKGHYLVPPPPPYAPSILPELAYSRAHGAKKTTTQETRKESPYSKYIYCRHESDYPQSIRQNSSVTTWNVDDNADNSEDASAEDNSQN